jgi:hypothetical protein
MVLKKSNAKPSRTDTKDEGTGMAEGQPTVAEASDPKIFLDLLQKLNSEPVSEEKMRSFEERLARLKEKLRKPRQGR